MGILDRLFKPKVSKPDVQTMAAEKDIEGLVRVLDYEKGKHRRGRECGLEARKAAADALGELKSEQAVGHLCATLMDYSESEIVRQAAAEALGKIGSLRALECLFIAQQDLSSSSPASVRRSVGLAMDRIEWQPTNERGQAFYYWATRQWDELARLGKPALEFLCTALENWEAWQQLPITTPFGHAIGHSRAYYAIEALGKVGDPQALDFLIAVLEGKYVHVQKNAKGLHRLEYSWVRRKAAEVLGRIGYTRAVEPLIAALEDRQVRKAAADALTSITGESLGTNSQRWKRWWKGHRPDVKKLAAEKDVEGLIRALGYEAEGKDWESRLEAAKIRRDAANALGELGSKQAVEPLIVALKDPNSHVWANVREAAAKALGEIGDIRAVEPLIEALEDSLAWTREAATEALCKIEWQPTDESDKALYYWATRQWDELARLGKPALEFLSAKLENWKAWLQPPVPTLLGYVPGDSRPYFAIEALGKVGNSQAVDFLISVLEGRYDHILKDAKLVTTFPSPSPGDFSYYRRQYLKVRAKAAEALGKIGDKRAIQPLIAALQDRDTQIRKSASEALGRIGDRVAVEPLIMGLKDKEPEVKESAAKALAQIGWQPTTASEAAAYYLALQNWEKLVELGKPAVEYLIAGLETTHWTADVHKAAARALARITGEDFGVDADLWKQWWQKQK